MDNKREETCLLQKMSEHNEVLSACVTRMDAMLSRLRGTKCADPRVGEEHPLGAFSWWLSGNNARTIETIKALLRESGLTFEQAFGGAE